MTRKTITWHEAAQMTVDELLELAVQNNLYKKRAVTFLTRDNLLRLLQSCGAIEDEHSRVEARSSSLLRGMRSHYSPERPARARYSPPRRDEVRHVATRSNIGCRAVQLARRSPWRVAVAIPKRRCTVARPLSRRAPPRGCASTGPRPRA